MLVPPRKSGENEYRVSFDKPTGIATETLFAKDEAEAKRIFKRYVSRDLPIRRIRKIS